MNVQKIIPSLCVVPIVGLHSDGSCGPFLGTGAFVGKNKYLVSCDHVLAEWDGSYGISAHEDKIRLYKANPIARDSNSDLACLSIEEYVPPFSFPMANDAEITPNQIICVFEYGTTEVAGTHINFTPSTRMGNVTRLRNLSDKFGKAGDHMLELSFPALKGASGAPVILRRSPFTLWGVINANVARELHPAHVERILDESGEVTEETKFYLPQGLAIHVKHVRSLLERIES